MTLIELRYVVSLAHTQHFGRAAQVLNIKQSTLSMAVRKLEEELGVLLFERSKSGIRPTQTGTQIIAQAQRVLAQADSISQLAEQAREHLAYSLRFGVVSSLGPYLLPQLLASLSLAADQLQLQTSEANSAALRQSLRQAEVDAILLGQSFAEPEIVTQVIYREPLVVFMPPSHPLAAQTSIASHDLQSHKLLMLGEEHCLTPQMRAAFLPTSDQSIACSSLETLLHMLAMGLGVSILPASLMNSVLYAPQALVSRPLQSQPTRDIVLAWRASFPNHKAIDALRRAIQMTTWQFTTNHHGNGAGLLVENQTW